MSAASRRRKWPTRCRPAGRSDLTLSPGLFAQAFTRIELEGARQVERVQLFEANGDGTVIAFRELGTGPELSADEAARLAQ